MKNCPKCRVECRDDAEWCWHCGYAYEGACGRAAEPASLPSREPPDGGQDSSPVDPGPTALR